MSGSEIIYRKAVLDDVPALHDLIGTSARTLSTRDYTSEQIEAALGTVWGVDEELIRDQTFFVVEVNIKHSVELVGCGGWSRRDKLFGSSEGSEMSPLLDPDKDASRIRAFFVRPDWSRQGIGKMLIELCEKEARQAGYSRMELMATLPGHRLYAACGYLSGESVNCGPDEATSHPCIFMHRSLID